MQLVISDKVQKDIIEIYKYIAKDSLRYASQTINNIYSMIAVLERFPHVGRFVPELLDKQYRELLYKNYRIVYSIQEDENIVFSHFIIHGKRNFNSFYDSYILEE